MALIDELRSMQSEGATAAVKEKNLQRRAGEILSAVRLAAREAAAQKKQELSGYMFSYVSDGYTESKWMAALPTVRDYEMRAEAFNRERRYHDGGLNSASAGRSEHRLYAGFFVAENRTDAEYIRTCLIDGLKKEGFHAPNVSVEELEDIYVIETAKETMLTRRVTKTITTRKGANKLYTIYTQIRW